MEFKERVIMVKRIVLVLILSFIIGLIPGCSLIKRDGGNNDINHEDQLPNPDDSETDTVREMLDKMSLEEKIGQMLMAGIEGYDITENSKDLIRKYKVGGIIVLGKNVKSTKQLLGLLNDLKRENSGNSIPVFLSVDEEGGRISRMPEELRRLPTNKAIGEINSKEFSGKLGSLIAYEISSFGFNMDFAPVLDINSNPINPVIGDRSFGSNFKVVSDLGIETMKGIQSGGIISVVKHFPGHGDTAVDSHMGLPSIDKDLKDLERFELIPFSDAINNGADAVMLAHILFAKIDRENPSSMSKTIITDILRNKLNFQGVVVTDDMTMGAIMKNYDIGEASVKSVKAGADIVLVCHGYNNQVKAFEALTRAAREGEISEHRIDESVYRILKLKEKYGLKDEVREAVDVEEINRRIETLLKDYVR